MSHMPCQKEWNTKNTEKSHSSFFVGVWPSLLQVSIWKMLEHGWECCCFVSASLCVLVDKCFAWQTRVQQICVCCDKGHLLSRQKYACCDKTFVATKLCLSRQNICHVCRDKHTFCHDKRGFVTTNTCLSWQKFCCDKHTFVTTKLVFCCNKHVFVMTKIILEAAPASDSVCQSVPGATRPKPAGVVEVFCRGRRQSFAARHWRTANQAGRSLKAKIVVLLHNYG